MTPFSRAALFVICGPLAPLAVAAQEAPPASPTIAAMTCEGLVEPTTPEELQELRACVSEMKAQRQQQMQDQRRELRTNSANALADILGSPASAPPSSPATEPPPPQ
jgi:hypothetical protein